MAGSSWKIVGENVKNFGGNDDYDDERGLTILIPLTPVFELHLH